MFWALWSYLRIWLFSDLQQCIVLNRRKPKEFVSFTGCCHGTHIWARWSRDRNLISVALAACFCAWGEVSGLWAYFCVHTLCGCECFAHVCVHRHTHPAWLSMPRMPVLRWQSWRGPGSAASHRVFPHSYLVKGVQKQTQTRRVCW